MYKLIISQTFVSNTKLRGFCWTEIKLWIRVKGIFHVTPVVDVIDCIKFDMKALPLLMLLTMFYIIVFLLQLHIFKSVRIKVARVVEIFKM